MEAHKVVSYSSEYLHFGHPHSNSVPISTVTMYSDGTTYHIQANLTSPLTQALKGEREERRKLLYEETVWKLQKQKTNK